MKTSFCILPDMKGERADKFIASILPGYSRSFWQKQIEKGCATLDGATLRVDTTIRPGNLEIIVEEYAAQQIDLPVIYEDDEVVVINKSAGILTHAKGVLAEEATIADFVRPRTTDGIDTNRPGIVHRLDRDTSGVIIAAKTTEAKHWLQAQFSQRKVKKTYIALVEGRLDQPEAILRLPIERNPKTPQQFRVGAGGKPAETAYRVIEELPHTTLVQLTPHTGRTHQLRVHMAYLGHPIVGDRLYGTEEPVLHGRLFLHAASLEVTLPSRVRKVFTAPLPAELEQYLSAQRNA